MGLGRAVGEDDAFVDEVMVVGEFAEAAAVGHELMVLVAVIPDALVFPFPDGAAHQAGVLVEDIIVFSD